MLFFQNKCFQSVEDPDVDPVEQSVDDEVGSFIFCFLLGLSSSSDGRACLRFVDFEVEAPRGSSKHNIVFSEVQI